MPPPNLIQVFQMSPIPHLEIAPNVGGIQPKLCAIQNLQMLMMTGYSVQSATCTARTNHRGWSMKLPVSWAGDIRAFIQAVPTQTHKGLICYSNFAPSTWAFHSGVVSAQRRQLTKNPETNTRKMCIKRWQNIPQMTSLSMKRK